MDYFEFFGIPVSFYPDEAGLKQRFLKNSKLYHPDFHTLASAEKQAEVLEMSTHNNEAYLTLVNFDKRLKYILETKGILQERNTELPQSFLFEMMEINEAIMELELDFEEQKYKSVLQEVTHLEKTLLESVKSILENYDAETTPDTALEPVKDFFLKRKYLWRIKENLDKFAPASKEVR